MGWLKGEKNSGQGSSGGKCFLEILMPKGFG
jgi:hypothetical protein